MRQNGDIAFLQALKKVRIRELDDKIEKLFRSRLINEKDALYPTDELYKFTENVLDKSHTERKLKRLSNTLIYIDVTDFIPEHCEISRRQIKTVFY